MSTSPGGTPQLALDLGHRPALGREDFLVAECNRAAVDWIDRWPGWPGPALVIFGSPGCGKTHLAEAWRHRSHAVSLVAAELGRIAPRDALGDARACVLDGFDQSTDQPAALHLYNSLAEAGGHLLITAGVPPARQTLALADLASRLRAAPAVAVNAPDDALLAAILVKLFADRQLHVGEDVLDFVVNRMERSFAMARRLVAAIDTAALASRRPITVPLARAVLGQMEP